MYGTPSPALGLPVKRRKNNAQTHQKTPKAKEVTTTNEYGHHYPKGYGSYTVNIYPDSYLKDALYLLDVVNEALENRGSDIRIITLEAEPERNRVRFSLNIEDQELPLPRSEIEDRKARRCLTGKVDDNTVLVVLRCMGQGMRFDSVISALIEGRNLKHIGLKRRAAILEAMRNQ